jgi:hypothetical protein
MITNDNSNEIKNIIIKIKSKIDKKITNGFLILKPSIGPMQMESIYVNSINKIEVKQYDQVLKFKFNNSNYELRIDIEITLLKQELEEILLIISEYVINLKSKNKY